MLDLISAPLKSKFPVETVFLEEKIVSISVEDHIGLALKCASRYVKNSIEVRDSEEYSIALIGLWDAASTYDPHINDAFSTYAWKCMRNRILDSFKFNQRKKRNIPLVRISELDNLDFPEEQAEEKLPDLDFDKIFSCDDSEGEKHQRDKQMLKMRFLENKSWQEIGDCFDMTRAGARHCAFNAIEKIRAEIED